MSIADDRELIHRTRRGDLVAFGDLVRQHQTVVYNVAYRMFGNRSDAEDSTQETFLRAYRALDSFDVERPMVPWLKRIAVNVCINMLEKERVRTAVTVADINHPAQNSASMDDWAHTRPSPEQELELSETAMRIRSAILQLPPRYRAVIELRHFQNMSYNEMSEFMGRSLSNVKSDLFRARRLLAQSLGDES